MFGLFSAGRNANREIRRCDLWNRAIGMLKPVFGWRRDAKRFSEKLNHVEL